MPTAAGSWRFTAAGRNLRFDVTVQGDLTNMVADEPRRERME